MYLYLCYVEQGELRGVYDVPFCALLCVTCGICFFAIVIVTPVYKTLLDRTQDVILFVYDQ